MDRATHVVVWSQGLPEGSCWLVERSYPLRYVLDVLGLSEAPGDSQELSGRRWLWLPKGQQPDG